MSALHPKADFAGRDQYVRLGKHDSSLSGTRNPRIQTLTSVREKISEAGVISQFQQKVSAWSIDSNRVAVKGPPPKDPDDDDDQNEEDEEDDGKEEEPAVIREPDE